MGDSDNSNLLNDSMSKGISNLLKQKATDKNFKLKYLGLSGHDTNLVPFLKKLGKININCLIKEYNLLINNKKPHGDYNCIRNVAFASNLIWEFSEISYIDKNSSKKVT